MELRAEDEPIHGFVSPYKELNAGLWSLFLGATGFLGLRIWVKCGYRSYRLWYDDWILVGCWFLLLANNALIVYQFDNGYVLEDSTQKWDDRMHILINISSCGTLIGQALTKTAFAVTLLRMANRYQNWFLWFCIVTMNAWMITKVIVQWAKVCGKPSYDNWYRLDFCVGSKFRDDFKEGGNIYNIVMDFIFACFPWLIVRKLEMRRVEKIGLCLTMSLGIIVAVVSAIRVGWKDEGNDRDEYYMFRNGLSQVWYSSEITGTIIVQCIPVLRPILQEFQSSIRSKTFNSTTTGRRSTIRLSLRPNNKPNPGFDDRANILPRDKNGVPLNDLPNRNTMSDKKSSFRISSLPIQTPETPRRPTHSSHDWWDAPARDTPSLDAERDGESQYSMNEESDRYQYQGLSPRPRNASGPPVPEK
ncbi:unnamed protein product [Clonostachys rosea]|uniref:Rhodopsin domain-containing protein n=1 Tax=Bionectria ochroleuca TaxID=29856 RepID=A0ABY6TQW0_BIOOC|nr:unnamed protein product [Clonostachys rosea]